MEESQQNSVVGEELPANLFYPPNDKEDFEITRDEVDQIKQALKNEKFRKMLDEYAEEVQVKLQLQHYHCGDELSIVGEIMQKWKCPSMTLVSMVNV